MKFHTCPKHGEEECDVILHDKDTHHTCTNPVESERYKGIWKE